MPFLLTSWPTVFLSSPHPLSLFCFSLSFGRAAALHRGILFSYWIPYFAPLLPFSLPSRWALRFRMEAGKPRGPIPTPLIGLWWRHSTSETNQRLRNTYVWVSSLRVLFVPLGFFKEARRQRSQLRGIHSSPIGCWWRHYVVRANQRLPNGSVEVSCLHVVSLFVFFISSLTSWPFLFFFCLFRCVFPPPLTVSSGRSLMDFYRIHNPVRTISAKWNETNLPLWYYAEETVPLDGRGGGWTLSVGRRR